MVDAITAADFCRRFVVNARKDLSAIRQNHRTGTGQSNRAAADKGLKTIITMTVDLLMKLVGGDRCERTVLVVQSGAIGIAIRAVGTTITADVCTAKNGTVGSREVAPTSSCGCTITLEIVAV